MAVSDSTFQGLWTDISNIAFPLDPNMFFLNDNVCWMFGEENYCIADQL